MKKYNYLVSDVDGILTDGGHYYSTNGKELKKFGSNDKDALKRIKELFVENIIFVSADERGFAITKKRIVEELGYELKLVPDKDRAKFLSSLGGKKIYLGDGIGDNESFAVADLSLCLQDSTPQAKKAADHILDTVAGKNVFSHVLNLLVEDENKPTSDTKGVTKPGISSMSESINDLNKLMASIQNLKSSEKRIAEFCENIAGSYTGKNKVVFCGVGKNATLSEMICEFLHPYDVVSITLDPHRAVHGNLGLLNKEDILIISTKSGNTAELIYLMECLNRKMKIENLFLIVSNPEAELKKRFYFKDVLVLPSDGEIAKFSHSPQTTILLYAAVMMVLVNRISEKKNLTERDYLLNHQAGEIGKSFKGL
jgi:D-arabinose 5-phosphate isomerase GutQ/3-deoxy-D-manno-octulosonate 8-phosphate phosphatase KdsC-like HAD superfamily phosphatase